MRCRVARDCEHDVSPCEPLNYPDDSATQGTVALIRVPLPSSRRPMTKSPPTARALSRMLSNPRDGLPSQMALRD
jgi:hypothetical protein